MADISDAVRAASETQSDQDERILSAYRSKTATAATLVFGGIYVLDCLAAWVQTFRGQDVHNNGLFSLGAAIGFQLYNQVQARQCAIIDFQTNGRYTLLDPPTNPLKNE